MSPRDERLAPRWRLQRRTVLGLGEQERARPEVVVVLLALVLLIVLLMVLPFWVAMHSGASYGLGGVVCGAVLAECACWS